METNAIIEWISIPNWFSQDKMKQAEALILKFMKNRIFSLKITYSAIPEQFIIFDNIGLDILKVYDLQDKLYVLFFKIDDKKGR